MGISTERTLSVDGLNRWIERQLRAHHLPDPIPPVIAKICGFARLLVGDQRFQACDALTRQGSFAFFLCRLSKAHRVSLFIIAYVKIYTEFITS